ADVADAGGQKRLVGGTHVVQIFVPVADEQERAQTDQLPENEQEQQIVGQHQPQHAEREQRQHAVVALVAHVALHVLQREDVHHEADQRDDHQHHRADAAHFPPHAEHQVPVDGPGDAAGGGSAVHDAHQDAYGENECHADGGDADPVALTGQPLAEKRDDDRGHQRKQGYEPCQFYHAVATFRSLTRGLSVASPVTTAA